MKRTVVGAGRPSWRERRLREWMAALPAAEPLRALGMLAQSVRAVNAAVMDPAVRIALLRCYESPVTDLGGALCKVRSQCSGASLVTLMHSEIAQGFQMALVPELGAELRQEAALGAMRQLREVLRAAYRAYIPAPPGLWRRIHALFRAAGTPGDTLNEVYSGILLLGWADPYALPLGGIDAVSEITQELQDRAILNTAQGFAIIPDSDRVGDATATKAGLFLDTEAVLLELAAWRARLQSHGTLPMALADKVLPDLAERLFSVLGESWRPGPKRKSPRVRLGGERWVCYGLPALRRLRDAEATTRTFVDLDRVWQESDEQRERLSDSSAGLPPARLWTIRDAGRSGLWLSCQELDIAPPAPGSWIGIKDPQGTVPWRAAVVRWLKRARPQEYAVGVELLGEAQTLAILRIGDRPQGVTNRPRAIMVRTAGAAIA